MVRQRSATPLPPVRIRVAPPKIKATILVALIFIQADEGGLVCNQCARALYVIAAKSRMASRASVHFHRRLDYIQRFALIPFRFSADYIQGLRLDYIHAYGVIGYGGNIWQETYYLNILNSSQLSAKFFANR